MTASAPRPLAALLALVLLGLPAAAHVFHPHPAVGLDVFLDQGPALIDVDGGVCKAEHILSSGNEAIATVGFKKKVAETFFLPVYGQQAGLTTVTVTVNDGTAKIGGETVPCGEGGTQYVFEVRVWPDRETYEKKLGGLMSAELKAWTQASKAQIKEIVDATKDVINGYKAGLVSEGTTPAGLAASLGVVVNLSLLATTHRQLRETLISMSQGGSDQLVACGFAEGFVVDAGFLPPVVAQGGGGAPAQVMDKLAAAASKAEAAVEKTLKKGVSSLQKLAAKGGVAGDANVVVNPFPVGSSPLPFDTTGVLAGTMPLHISGVSSWDVWEFGTGLQVTGLGAPDSEVTLRVHDGAGDELLSATSRTDANGLFSQTFDKGLPRGWDVQVVLEQGDRLTRLNATVANATDS